jgi:hypothetical protein
MSKQAAQASPQNNKDGEDLNSILNEAQRADVTLLVANCTESMRAQITENFNPSAGLNKELLGDGQTDEEKMMHADPATWNVEAYDTEKKLKEECEKDVNSDVTQKLKQNALHDYDEWRETVLMRIGEVVNTKSQVRKQLERQTSSQPPKPKSPVVIGKITDVPQRQPNLKFKDVFPPTKTPLTKLPMDRRTLVLHSLLLLLISLEHYNAYSRILMLNLTSSLKLPLKTFEQDEYTTAKGLLESAKELTANEETQKKQEANRENRKWKVGLATAAGAAILGVSGGMAAPLVASGVGSVMGGLGLGATAAAGYLGSVAGSTLLVGGLFGAYGGRMTGQMMDKYAREVEDFEFLPVHSDKKTSEDEEKGAQEASDHDHKLRVTICISGWLTEKNEVTKPWRVIGTGAEVFALKWELEALLNLGHAMDGLVGSAAWGYAQKEIIKRTIFADLMSALWPIGLLKVARVLDNPFSVAKARADKAGEVLADALINRAQGERPVTLIGYSLGARVIYSCLKALADRKAFGLVEHAVIMGAPTPSDSPDWRILRTAVSGRLVNVYSQNDYLLGFMYRTSALQYGVAGLEPIRGLAGVENVDVSEDVDGHTRYRFLVGSILKKIGFDDIDMDAIAEEQDALQKMLKDEKKNSLQAQRKRLLRRESYKGKPDEEKEAEEEAMDMEKQVKDKTQKSMMARVIEWWYTPRAPNTKDAEKAASNLQKSADKSGGTANAQSYTQYIASKLPSIPGAASMPDGKKDDISAAAGQAATTTSSYVKAAQDYLPAMPSFGSNKSQQKKAATATDKATGAAKDTASTLQKGATGVAGTTKDVVEPTIKNTLNPAGNPAVKAAQDTAKKAPIIHQAADRVPGANKAAKVTSDTVGTTVQNTAQTASGALTSSTSKAANIGTSGASKASSAGQGGATAATNAASSGMNQLANTGKAFTGQGQTTPSASAAKASPAPQKSSQSQQSYFSRAANYMPSGTSLPSMPSFGGNKRGPPKLQKRDSGTNVTHNKSSPASPKPQRTPSASIKSTPPKLNRLPSNNVKSSPPKLDRTPSGQQSPGTRQVKLERSPSGVKSPPAKLERASSGLKNSVSAGVSGTANQVGQGAGAAKKQAEGVAGAATGAVGGLTSRFPGFGGGK